MGHGAGFIGGIVGSIVTYVLLGISDEGGGLQEVVMFVAIVLGFAIGYPSGYMIGTLPFFTSDNSTSDQLPKSTREFAPQIVGSDCNVCGEKIIFVTDGKRCEKCDVVFHASCASECPKCDSGL